MRRPFVYLASSWLLMCATGAADTLYTEPHGAAYQYPSALASWQFLGIRFELNQPAQLTSLHTVLGDSPSSFFAALVSLPSVTSLPQGGPFAPGEVLYSTVFNLSWDVVPIDIPFNVSVGPGAYAIVFGGGLFGSSAYISAVAETYNSVASSTGFVWVPDSPPPYTPWHNTPLVSWDVTVKGTLIPEPSGVAFAAVGTAALVISRRRRQSVMQSPGSGA